MDQYKNPNWWTTEHDSAWNRVKDAMKRDWDQTKHDMGGDEPNTNQKIGNTTRQARGAEAIPPRGTSAEPAYRFGYGARSRYGDEYSEWNDELEARLKEDWGLTDPTRPWNADRDAIRYGWDYDVGAEDDTELLAANDL